MKRYVVGLVVGLLLGYGISHLPALTAAPAGASWAEVEAHQSGNPAVWQQGFDACMSQF